METITFNLTSDGVRYDHMEGRRYLVVPMVMLAEGVHAGSLGPLYYPGDELSKTPEAWNHKPIVVYHPEMNGKGVSACDPIILTSRKVGLIMNTRFGEDKKLRAEAWMEESRMDAVDERIRNAIENKKMMELSTGLFTDNEQKEGEHNGKKYTAIARNYRPDHLALLPDKLGAFSIKDGAGFLRTNAEGKTELTPRAAELILNLLTEKGATMDRKKKVDALIANKESGWLEADREVLEKLPDVQFDKIAANADKKKEETPNPAPNPQQAPPPKAPEQQPGQNPPPPSQPGQPQQQPPAQPAKNEVLTAEQYIQAAPPGMRELLSNAYAIHNQEKTRLICLISANAQNKFTKEYLQTLDLQVLQGVASLAAPVEQQQVAPLFLGAAAPAPLHNSYADLEPLPHPTMNFSKAS